MNGAADFLLAMRGEVDRAAEELAVRLMTVASVADGLVLVEELGTGEAHGEAYARLAGIAVDTGDTVLVAELPGRGYRAAGRTRVVLGKVQAAEPDSLAFEVPLIGQVYPLGDDTSTATVGSSTDLVTWATAYSRNWPDLPDGTYDVVTDGSILAAHSASGDVSLRVVVGATAGGSVTVPVDTVVPPRTRIAVANTLEGVDVSGGAGTSLSLQYKPVSAGVAYARNAVLRAWAVRTA